jgi:nucleoside-diphosphate-sugar epimerase
MKYFITGGCGFIGSHIAEELANRGESVVIYDNLSSGYEHNIQHIQDKCTFIKGDIREFQQLCESMNGADYVFHEAALVSVFDSVERPEDNHSINLTGMLNVLLAARENKVRRVVFASSAAVYGNDPVLPKTEDMVPQPESPYALAKITGEYYLRVFSSLYNVETVSLRYFNVFGPRQDPSSMYSGVISKFTDMLKNGATPLIFGDGKQTRDFVYVKDVVQANLLAMHTDKAGKGEVFNVATNNTCSLLELIDIMNTILGTDIKPAFRDARAGDIRHSYASVDRAKAVLGYAPAYSLKAGLESLLAYEGR